MAKSDFLGVRIPSDELAALKRFAQDDNRSVSSFARIIIAKWLKDNEGKEVARGDRRLQKGDGK